MSLTTASSFLLSPEQKHVVGGSRVRRSVLASLKADAAEPWYSHSDLERDRSHILETSSEVWSSPSSKYVVLEESKGMYHRVLDTTNDRSETEPLFFKYQELEQLVGADEIVAALRGESETLIAWVGTYKGSDYFVCHLASEVSTKTKVKDLMGDENVSVAGLRDFGDRLERRIDAAILASSNGLVEFHKAHPFCARCGSKTKVAKAGACRRCTSCKSSVYPRIDVAAIMLITSRCGEYALLGRKAMWPQGRYSTLAGFCEVGETLEQCCARETLEESGVLVDLRSVRFVCSQPWPFPRSLMAGFRGEAMGSDLPSIKIDKTEMEDIQWFHRDFVRDRLDGGSTALDFEPDEDEKEFHLPGQSSLARLMITQWATETRDNS